MNHLKSILDSTKVLLGLDPESDELSEDILAQINDAIFSLLEMGVGPDFGFVVTGREETFDDYLGEDNKLIPAVRLYFFYKAKLGFDTPSGNAMIEVVKERIRELEWRIRVWADPRDVFE